MRKFRPILIKPIGFPPIVPQKNKPPDIKDLPVADKLELLCNWLGAVSVNTLLDDSFEELRQNDKEKEMLAEYEKTFVAGDQTGRSSWFSTSDNQQDLEQNSRPRLKLSHDFLNDSSSPFKNRTEDLKSDDEEDGNISLEIRDMDSESNKFEPSEFVEYKDLSWCIALLVQDIPNAQRTMYQRTVLSYQSGIQRIDLTNSQKEKASSAVLIKYRYVNGYRLEVLPIYSSLSHTNLINYRTRINKSVELDVYGIINFVDIAKDPNHFNYQSMVWVDAVGAISLTAAMRSNIKRKLNLTEHKVFAPLRMCKLKIVAEFAFNVPDGFFPKWNVVSMHPILEEDVNAPSIGRNLWPARVLRFDDLVVTSSDKNGTWLKSFSKPKVVVFAGGNLTGVLNSAGPEYFRRGVMSAVVVPYFTKQRFAYYDALVAGPLRVLVVLTEGRIFNFCPKTWPPSIRREWLKHRALHDSKQLVREEPRSLPKLEISPKGSKEFYFDFQH